MGQRRGVLCLFVALVAVGACHGAATDAGSSVHLRDNTITVGSFDFAESELLAEIYSQAMEAQGLPRAAGVRPRSARVRRPGARCRARRVRSRVRRYRACSSRRSGVASPMRRYARPTTRWRTRSSSEDVTVLALRAGAGRERVRRHSRARRRRTTSIASATSRPVRVPSRRSAVRLSATSPVVPRGPRADLWPEVQGVRPARRGRVRSRTRRSPTAWSTSRCSSPLTRRSRARTSSCSTTIAGCSRPRT